MPGALVEAVTPLNATPALPLPLLLVVVVVVVGGRPCW
jgi:hypothetical protein